MNELKLLLILMNTSRLWKKEELAEKLEVSIRTIERYVNKLKTVGFIFVESRGRVQLQQYTTLYNELSRMVYFNEEDAATLYNALEAIDTNSEYKNNLRNKLATLYSSKSIREKIIKLQSSQKVQLVMMAIEERKRVILKNYSSPSSNTKTDRLVEPYQMTDGNKQVWCWEIESGKNKVFNISRIEEVQILKEHWKSTVCHQAGFTDAFRMISINGHTIHITLKLNQMAYNLMIEEYPLTEKDITQTSETEWTYDGEVSSMKGIGRFVIGLADCIIIETKELKDYLKTFAEINLIK